MAKTKKKDMKAEEKQLREFYKTAFELRGYFLDQVIWVQTHLSDLLATYFCGPYKEGNVRRQLLLMSLFNTGRFSFEDKIKLFEEMLEYENYPKKGQAKRLVKKLRDLVDFRNKLSYNLVKASLSVSKRSKTGVIELEYEGKSGRKTEKVTQKQIHDKLEEVQNVMEELVAIHERLAISWKGP
jgi:hypothetical protein